MKAHFCHFNFNVLDLERSMAFYEEALDLREVRRITDESFVIVYLGDGKTDFTLELTWIKERTQPYDLGEQEFIELWHNICRRFAVKIPHVIAEGGHERFFSVLNGLRHIPDDALVAVHDGVRPFVSFDTLDRCFAKAKEDASAVPVMPLDRRAHV